MRQRWRLAQPEDVEDVVSRLRPEDIEECFAMQGVHPAEFFSMYGYDRDNTYVIYNRDGDNVALGGTVGHGNGLGQIWMIATPLLENHPVEFLRYSKAFIKETTKEYSVLFNWVSEANPVHIKWLQWCGFTFIKRHEQFGALGTPFYTFVKVQ